MASRLAIGVTVLVALIVVFGAIAYYYSFPPQAGSGSSTPATTTTSQAPTVTTGTTTTTTTTTSGPGGVPGGVVVDYTLVNIGIREGKGSKTYKGLAVIESDGNTCVTLKPVLFSLRGDAVFTLSGKAYLIPVRGEANSTTTKPCTEYSISMPCIASTTPCYRVQVVIPGYDQPLRLESGRYNLSLELSWNTEKGEAEAVIAVFIEKARCGAREWIKFSYEKPGNTTGWVTAEGSTRSYALLLDRVKASPETRSGEGVFHLYLWVFAPQAASGATKIVVADADTGAVVLQARAPLARQGSYLAVTATLGLPPGHYQLAASLPGGILLEEKIVVEENG